MAEHRNPANALTARIVQGIPLAAAMDFRITALNEQSIDVMAPLTANYNVHGTGFAGSIYSTATLAAWAFTTHTLEQAGIAADVVMAKADIRYRKPVNGDIHCHCDCEQAALHTFIQQVNQRGKGRLLLTVKVGENAEASLTANMVASLK